MLETVQASKMVAPKGMFDMPAGLTETRRFGSVATTEPVPQFILDDLKEHPDTLFESR
jgi:hypothetical protein